MAREIKTTIAVDGEAAFKRAINDANTSMRNLGTQLTLAQAQFKKDGDAMKLAETRSKALSSEIEQQEKIVKALEKAVEDSSNAFGENSTKTEKWEAELNRAKAKLVNLQSELTLNEAGLDRNGKAFDDSSQKAADYQATLQNIGKNVSFEAITKGLDGITGTVESAISKVIDLGKKLTEAMREASEWADDITTEAIKNQLSVEDQQRMEYASKFADTSVDTIMSARNKVIQKMVKGWKNSDGIDMWEFLKINTDTSRDPLDVMFELGEKLKNITWFDKSIVRADEWSQEVFGKGFQDLLPLFNYGEENFRARMAEAPIVSDENMERLTQMQDAFDKLDSQIETLKHTALAELSPTLEKIVSSLSGMLEQFNKWLETEEGKQAMSDLSAAIEELFSGLSDIDFSTVIDTITKAITDLKDGLNWLAEHKQDIYDALKVIAAGFALLKVAKLASDIGSIVTGFKGLGLGGNNNTTAEPDTTGTDTTTGGGDGSVGIGGTGLIAAIKNAINGKLLNLSSWANAFNMTNAGFVSDWFFHNTQTGRSVNPEYGGSFSLENLWNGFWTSVNDKIRENQEAQAKYESGETWSILDPASKERHDKLVEQTEFEEKAREYHAEHTEPTLTPEQWEAMTKAERDLYMLTHPIPTQEEMNQEYLNGTTYWNAAPGAATEAAAEEKTPYEILQEIGGKLSDEQKTAAEAWWDEFRENPFSEATDEKWDGLEELFTGNSALLEELSNAIDNWFTDNEDQSYLNNNNLFSDAVAQLQMNVESGKAIAEKVAGADIKRFNSLPTEIQAAAQRGTAAGVSGIRVQMDGTTVGRLVAPTVSQWIGERSV